jgi:hypothetical protein
MIMRMASILDQYHDAFLAKYGPQLMPEQYRAIDAIRRCRTPASGEFLVHCPDCGHSAWKPHSCGHRSCPQCQNHEASVWLDRQQVKLLPVSYFLVTFTLPAELRYLAFNNQRLIYDLMLQTAARALKDFGANPKNLGADMGMTAVLHTHTRRLDYHPHIHYVVPGGGVDKARKQWKKLKGKYLFNEFALATVFRARFLEALKQSGLSTPHRLPAKWVVDCAHVGKGQPALKYLSRYLYRGVISESSIVSNQDGKITFRYVQGRTRTVKYRTVKAEDFLWLVLQHVLPKGFRRVRDYGFLHGNAKKLLSLVQLILHVLFDPCRLRPRPVVKCPKCKKPLVIIGFRSSVWASG